MDDFVNKALAKGNVIAVAQLSPEPTHIISNTIGMNIVDQKYAPETVHSVTLVNNVASKIFVTNFIQLVFPQPVVIR